MIRTDDIVATETARAGPPAINRFVDEVRRRYGTAVEAVLFYGSCRRQDQPDGLYDLYVILDSYRVLPWFERLLARMLPPNVYYLEVGEGETLRRSKCTVIDAADFRRGTSRWFHSYLWGRFAQPVTMAFARDDVAASRTRQYLANAVTTFLTRVAPLIEAGESVDTATLWIRGLAACYRAELRNEGPDRAAELFAANRDYYEALTTSVAGEIPSLVPLQAGQWTTATSASGHRRTRLGWRARRIAGKFLSVARILKAWMTFDGGFDYLMWKLQRHAGREIEVPPRVRRAPLIFVWGFLWRLYRQGVFR